MVLTRGGAEVASWRLTRGGCSALAVVDELARLQLAARRAGCAVSLRDACGELRGLIELAGLSDVLPIAPPSARARPEL